MDAVLHRMEALPGEGRYAVTFRRPDGSEQTAIAQLGPDGVAVAEASLPSGWTRSTPAFLAVRVALEAFAAARRHAPTGGTLLDVDGGWDVSLGNVTLIGGVATCTGHGAMVEDDDGYVCSQCGARAILSGGSGPDPDGPGAT